MKTLGKMCLRDKIIDISLPSVSWAARCSS